MSISIELKNNDKKYYNDIEHNYLLGVKYYKKAADLGNSNAMNNLANYYKDIEHNYQLAIQYYHQTTKTIPNYIKIA